MGRSQGKAGWNAAAIDVMAMKKVRPPSGNAYDTISLQSSGQLPHHRHDPVDEQRIDLEPHAGEARRRLQGKAFGRADARRLEHQHDPAAGPHRLAEGPCPTVIRVPDEIDTQRARRILEEIRRRLGNALSPELERDYLERLLDIR